MKPIKKSIKMVQQLRADISDIRSNLEFVTTQLIVLESDLTDYDEKTGELTETLEDFLEEETNTTNH